MTGPQALAENPGAPGSARPYVLLSAATSLDGYLDSAGPGRLLLSSTEDFDRVDAVRASADAILVGATTLRRDDPRLLVASERRRSERVARGLPEHPLKVTVTRSGELNTSLRLWSTGGDKLVFTVDTAADRLRGRLNGLADVVSTGTDLCWESVLDECGARGVRRLMVEGGGSVHTQLMSLNLADELHVVVAPLLVGEATAPRFLSPAVYPGAAGTARMRLLEIRAVGDVALLRYAPKERVS